MARIGRNEPCPCGSGRKFKKCCLAKQMEGKAAAPAGRREVSLGAEVAAVREAALKRQVLVRQLGVFVLFSSSSGDAWLLEASEMDGVRVAAAGREVEAEIVENAETIEINWTHRVRLDKQRLVATPYQAGAKEVFEGHPLQAVKAALKGIGKRLAVAASPHILDAVESPKLTDTP